MGNDVYRQCELRRRADDGSEQVEVVWIPAQFSHRGKALTIQIDGAWQTGWKVAQTYSAATRDVLVLQEGAQKIVEGVLDPHR